MTRTPHGIVSKMELIAEYDDDGPAAGTASEEGTRQVYNANLLKERFSVNIAPPVNTGALTRFENPFAKEYSYNPEYASISAPIQGPVVPHLHELNKTNLLGSSTPIHINDFSFHEQYVAAHSGPQAFSARRNIGKKKRKTEEGSSDPANLDKWKGPWAGYVDDDEVELPQPDPEQAEEFRKRREARQKRKLEPVEYRDETCAVPPPIPDGEDQDFGTETTTFHGAPAVAPGRTWVDPPAHLRNVDHRCYLPKKRIHTWSGHTKGVNTIRFFPEVGHLILSAGLDGKVKIWDVFNNRRCIRTYWGHERGVRDICFSNDGREILSAGLDRVVKLWDTETGQCKGRFSNRKVPYVAKFYPANNNEFLMGCSNNHIVQWDIRENKIVQTYDRHLGPVNTITFIDENRRFVSTSDDKSLRIWDYGINVEIKYISEPHMHAIAYVGLSPDGEWMACQSLDNQVVMYATGDKFRVHRKKRFRGHMNAGYACMCGFSPDGKYVLSGDGDGRIFIWDWKTSRICKTIRCHRGVCIGALWHPVEPSKVATCGWDGLINLWD